MAAQSLATSYSNFSINDVFGKPKSSSNSHHLQNDTAPDFMDKSRFAVPTGCDVSCEFLVLTKALSHTGFHRGIFFFGFNNIASNSRLHCLVPSMFYLRNNVESSDFGHFFQTLYEFLL